MMVQSIQDELGELEWSRDKGDGGDDNQDGDDENSSVFNPLITEVCDNMWDDYKAKTEMYKSESITPSDAEDRTYDDLLPIYAKAMRAKYVRCWELLYDQDKNQIYNTIKKTIDNLMDDEDMGWQDAIHVALKKRKFLFKELLANFHKKEKE